MIIPADESALAEAAEIIRRGGVIGYRTDTLYGLGADPGNADALSKIILFKGREEGKPILLLISRLEIIPLYIAHRSNLFDSIAQRFWPGPLTLIGKARSELPVALTAGTESIGVRLPGVEEVRRLVDVCGGALTATSANPSGQPPAVSASEVERYFPEIELVIDGGKVEANQPSTVLDLSKSKPRLIREGVIKRAELERYLSDVSAME